MNSWILLVAIVVLALSTLQVQAAGVYTYTTPAIPTYTASFVGCGTDAGKSFALVGLPGYTEEWIFALNDATKPLYDNLLHATTNGKKVSLNYYGYTGGADTAEFLTVRAKRHQKGHCNVEQNRFVLIYAVRIDS